MRSRFTGYYLKKDQEFKELWEKCTFILDANVLLNVYRYTQETQQLLLEILDALKERSWLPNQACLEYFNNRLNVISEQYKIYDEFPKYIKELNEKIIKNYKRHLIIDIPALNHEIAEFESKINNRLSEARRSHPDYSVNDPLLDRILSLFEGKVGNEYSPEELRIVYKEADSRFEKDIPPGYRDKKKQDDSKYGDYIIWRQSMDYAKAHNTPIIFVTDDKKDDWWLEFMGRTIGPRPELINEFYRETNNMCHIYQCEQFLEYAHKFMNLGDDPEKAIEEIKEVKFQKGIELLQKIGRIHREGYNKSGHIIYKMSEKAIDKMVNWFLSSYKDPSEGVPYDSEKEGYQYFNGGPYDPYEELIEKFPHMPENLIREAELRIFSYGNEWVKNEEY